MTIDERIIATWKLCAAGVLPFEAASARHDQLNAARATVVVRPMIAYVHHVSAHLCGAGQLDA